MATATANPWAGYWQGLPAGHFLFPAEGRRVARTLAATFDLAGARVLDYGSGYRLVARELAPHVGELWTWEPAEAVRRVAGDYLRGVPVRPFDPERDAGPFDLILVNSVVQYMTPGELAGLAAKAAGWLAPGGRLVLGDLVPPGLPLASDLVSLLGFSLRHSYLVSALRRSWAARRQHAAAERAAPMYRPTDAELGALAAASGLSLAWLPRNLTHFRRRRTAVLTKPEATA